eukprot:gene16314-biopygen11290
MHPVPDNLELEPVRGAAVPAADCFLKATRLFWITGTYFLTMDGCGSPEDAPARSAKSRAWRKGCQRNLCSTSGAQFPCPAGRIEILRRTRSVNSCQLRPRSARVGNGRGRVPDASHAIEFEETLASRTRPGRVLSRS